MSSLLRLAALLALVSHGCGSKEGDADRELTRVAEGVANRIVQALARSDEIARPYRCARLEEDDASPEVELGTIAGRDATRSGATVRYASAKAAKELVLGVIADARGADSKTTAALGRFHSAFRKAGVDLVVLLGGNGSTADEIKAHIDVMSQEGQWPILVLQGDRESVPAVHEAIERSGGSSARLLDGSRTRFVVMNGTVIATLPGLANSRRLLAGSRGCVHTPDDIDALAKKLSTFAEHRVWVGYAPPRQAAASASDITIGGVHVGELEQTAAIAASGARVVLHGAVDEAAFGPRVKTVRLSSTEPAILGVGSADPMPVTNERGEMLRSIATIVQISSQRLVWRRISGQ